MIGSEFATFIFIFQKCLFKNLNIKICSSHTLCTAQTVLICKDVDWLGVLELNNHAIPVSSLILLPSLEPAAVV